MTKNITGIKQATQTIRLSQSAIKVDRQNQKLVKLKASNSSIFPPCLSKLQYFFFVASKQTMQGLLTKAGSKFATKSWKKTNKKPIDQEDELSLDFEQIDLEEPLPTSLFIVQSPSSGGSSAKFSGFTSLSGREQRRISRHFLRQRNLIGEATKRGRWKRVSSSMELSALGSEADSCLDDDEEDEDIEGGKDKDQSEWIWVSAEEKGEKSEREGENIDGLEESHNADEDQEEETEEVDLTRYLSFDLELQDTTWTKAGDGGMRDEKRYERLKSASYISKTASLRVQWSSLPLPHSRQSCYAMFKRLIRQGIPDSKRPQIWQAAVGCIEFNQENPTFYDDVVERVFGERKPNRFYQIPSFNGTFDPDSHCLTVQALPCAARILWALTMEHPDIDFIPAMPDIVCILLTFLSEAEAYTVAHLMVEQSRSSRWFVSLSNRAHTLFLLTFQTLLEKHLPKLAAHMKLLGIAPRVFADTWMKRLFVSSLPYQTVLRIFDAYLNEGSKMLYRAGLGVLKTFAASLLRCKTGDSFLATLQQLAIQYEDADRLMKYAFSFGHMSRKNTARIDKANRAILPNVSEPAYKPMFLPVISTPSLIIEEHHFGALWTMLPSRVAIKNPVLLFSTAKHGFSLSSLLEKCDDEKPLILIIKDRTSRVFGGYSTEGFRMCSHFEAYYGGLETFIFTLLPEVKHWTWLAGHARCFTRVTTEGIEFGDGVGLRIDNELWHGSSEKCDTFRNDPLCGDKDFECVTLEVWGMK